MNLRILLNNYKIQKLLLASLCLLFSCNQNYIKQEVVYRNNKDSSTNFYKIIYPNSKPYKGFLFLVPGFGETSETILLQTDLPYKAAEKGILTIIPTFKTGKIAFGIDSLTQESFKEIVEEIDRKYEIKDKPIFFGGFSIGGSAAIKYAELADVKQYKIKPTAVFAIDPPLDFERFYYASKRAIRLSKDINLNQESLYMVERIEQEMSGSPQINLKNYHKISPFSFSDSSQQNIKCLKYLSIRIYSEPDINWWIKERRHDFYNMNILDGAAMINELNILGNKNAFLVITENKGFRQPGNTKHPHSWSIVDNSELIEWLVNQKEKHFINVK